MSLISDLYPDDKGQSVLQVAACESHTPTRVARSWVKHRIEEVIGQLSTELDDDQIEDMVQAFKRNGLL